MNDTSLAEPEAAGVPRIGPNAIIRTHEALTERASGDVVGHIFTAANLGGYLGALPETMVPEAEVGALHRAVRRALAPAEADAVMRDAGERTEIGRASCRERV